MCPGAVVGRHLRPWRSCAAGLETSGAIVGGVLRGWSFGQWRTYLSVTILNTPRGSLPPAATSAGPTCTRTRPHPPAADLQSADNPGRTWQVAATAADRSHQGRQRPPPAPQKTAGGHGGKLRSHVLGHTPTSRDPKTGLGWSGLIYPAWRGEGECGAVESGNHSQKKRGPPWLLCVTTPGSTPPRRGSEAGVLRDDRRGADGGGAVGLTWACSGCFGATRR